jgi:predicted esterase
MHKRKQYSLQKKDPKDTHTYNVGIVSGTDDRITPNKKGYELQQKTQNSQQDTNSKP